MDYIEFKKLSKEATHAKNAQVQIKGTCKIKRVFLTSIVLIWL